MSFKTPKGTELHIIKLKGKDYLPVQERVKWFREDKPSWGIKTSIVQMDEGFCLFKAEIFDETGRLIATGHKSETPQGFADNIEKSESGAIGRALALCGYGTQFAAELDEGTERIVDSPRESIKKEIIKAADAFGHTQLNSPPLTSPNAPWPDCPTCGKKMLKSKFESGDPFFCPNRKNHKITKQAMPPDYEDGDPGLPF